MRAKDSLALDADLPEDLIRLQSETIEKMASKIWGRDMRECVTISRCFCTPLFDYIEERLKKLASDIKE